MSRSVNCAAPQGKGRAERGRGVLKRWKCQERGGTVLENARRYATFIKVKGPEGGHLIEALTHHNVHWGFRAGWRLRIDGSYITEATQRTNAKCFSLEQLSFL